MADGVILSFWPVLSSQPSLVGVDSTALYLLSWSHLNWVMDELLMCDCAFVLTVWGALAPVLRVHACGASHFPLLVDCVLFFICAH